MHRWSFGGCWGWEVSWKSLGRAADMGYAGESFGGLGLWGHR